MEVLHNTLELADQIQISSLAMRIMCSRKGYSTVDLSEAPRVMLLTMLNTIKSFCGQHLKHVTLYLQEKPAYAKLLIEALMFASCGRSLLKFSPKVLWIDKNDKRTKNACIRSWEQLGIQTIYIVSTSQKTEDDTFLQIQTDDISVVITNYSRPSSPTAGLDLIKRLKDAGFPGIMVVYGASMASKDGKDYTQGKINCLSHGAHLATYDLEVVNAVVSELGTMKMPKIGKKLKK